MGALSITGIKPGSTSLKLTAGKITKTVPITVLSRNLLALFGDSQLIVDSDTSLTNMGPYPSGANPGTATSWPSDQSKQIASITGLRVIDLYYGGARIARDKTSWQGGWAMQSNRLASLVKADAANTPGVIVIYGFYSNDLHDGLTDTKPATDLSKIAAAYKAKFDELKAKYPQARILGPAILGTNPVHRDDAGRAGHRRDRRSMGARQWVDHLRHDSPHRGGSRQTRPDPRPAHQTGHPTVTSSVRRTHCSRARVSTSPATGSTGCRTAKKMGTCTTRSTLTPRQ